MDLGHGCAPSGEPDAEGEVMTAEDVTPPEDLVIGEPVGEPVCFSSERGCDEVPLEQRLFEIFSTGDAEAHGVGLVRQSDLVRALYAHRDVVRVSRSSDDVQWVDGSRNNCGGLLAAPTEDFVTWEHFRAMFYKQGGQAPTLCQQAWGGADGQGDDPAGVKGCGDGHASPNGRFHWHASKADQAFSTYCSFIANRAFTILVLYTVLLLVLLGSMQREVAIASNFSSFIRADGEALRRMDAYSTAMNQRKPLGRRLKQSVVSARDLTLYYEARDGGSMLREPTLREVKNLEERLRDLPGWKRICSTRVTSKLKWLCDRGESFLSYAAPQLMQHDGNVGVHYRLGLDGRGQELLPSPVVLSMLQHSNLEHTDLLKFLPTDFVDESGEIGTSAAALKSSFVWQLKVSGLANGETGEDISQEFSEFAVNELYPSLAEAAKEAKHVRLYFQGDVISGYEVSQTLANDAMWAIGSAAAVLFFLWLHTRSAVVSVCALVIMLLALPLAYVLTPVTLSSASFLAIFLTIGIGSDVVFVFYDFWSQAGDELDAEVAGKPLDAILGRRLEITLAAGVRNCFAAMATTSASFLANLASVLQPLREFGLFLGLSVLLAFVLLVLFLPPLMVLQERRKIRRERKEAKKAEGADLDGHKLSAVVPYHEPARGSTVELDAGPSAGCSSAAWGSAYSTRASASSPSQQDPRADSARSAGQQGQGRSRHAGKRCLQWMLKWVEACPASITLVSLLSVIVFVICTGVNVEVDRGIPDFFPEGHNQREVVRMADMFSAVRQLPLSAPPPPQSATVCEAVPPSTAGAPPVCSLHWCHASAPDTTEPLAGSGGRCWTRMATGTPLHGSHWNLTQCSKVELQGRLAISTMRSATAVDDWFAVWETAAPGMLGVSGVETPRSVSALTIAPLVLENWSSGHTSTANFFRMPPAQLELDQPGAGAHAESCVLETVCFFDVPACDLGDGWLPVTQGCPTIDGTYVDEFGGALVSISQSSSSCSFSGTWGTRPLEGTVEGSALTFTLHPWIDRGFLGPMSARLINGSIVFEGTSIPNWRGVARRLQAAIAEEAKTRAWKQALATAPMPRRLAGPQVAPGRRVIVSVVWGLRVAAHTPLVGRLDDEEIWSFDPTFDVSDPWAQRALFAMCQPENFPKDLAILTGARNPNFYCWMAKFRNHLLASDQRFPSRTFDGDAVTWYRGDVLAKEGVWAVDGRVAAAKVSYEVDVAKSTGAQAMWEYKGKWDAWIDDINSQSAYAVRRAWHVSTAWVQAEAEVAVVDSTMTSILVAAASGWLGALVFTGDPYLACLVVSIVIGVIIGLAFFMVCLAGWPLGPIEVISLIVFVGYSVTFSLHVAHVYHEEHVVTEPAPGGDADAPESTMEAWKQRRVRAVAAVLRVGIATLAAAASTLAAGAFLCCCTMLIFVKLGTVVIVVTLLSGVCTVVVLPAVLILVGPDQGSWWRRAGRYVPCKCSCKQGGLPCRFGAGEVPLSGGNAGGQSG